MNTEQINYLVNEYGNLKRNTRINTKQVFDGGAEHPLWALLNMTFPPPKLWKALRGADREQIRRAGEKLHAENIPYSFYTSYLKIFGKGHLKQQSPLTITKYKETANGAQSILTEYIGLMKYCISLFMKNSSILYLNDWLYK